MRYRVSCLLRRRRRIPLLTDAELASRGLMTSADALELARYKLKMYRKT